MILMMKIYQVIVWNSKANIFLLEMFSFDFTFLKFWLKQSFLKIIEWILVISKTVNCHYIGNYRKLRNIMPCMNVFQMSCIYLMQTCREMGEPTDKIYNCNTQQNFHWRGTNLQQYWCRHLPPPTHTLSVLFSMYDLSYRSQQMVVYCNYFQIL